MSASLQREQDSWMLAVWYQCVDLGKLLLLGRGDDWIESFASATNLVVGVRCHWVAVRRCNGKTEVQGVV